MAGFIDGDGCITFDRWSQRGRLLLTPMLIVFQKHPEAIHDIRELVGEGIVRRTGTGHRYDLRGSKTRPALEHLQPRLHVKGREAEILLEFLDCRKTRGPYDAHCLLLNEEMKELHRHSGGNRGLRPEKSQP